MRQGSSTPGRWLVVALALAAFTPARAAGAPSWTETPAGLGRGRAENVARSSAGRLFLAPRLTPIGGGESIAGPTQVWSIVAGGDGTVYLGTGPEGEILAIDRFGNRTLLLRIPEPMVTALAMTDKGVLLAAAPGGRIYRVLPDGTGEVWAETEERYVWALAVTADGRVFAGTGERGKILEIDRAGIAEPFFDSDESHIVTLLPTPDGDLLAGGAGRGLVYRVDAEGHALVLHDDELDEVAALAVDPDGGVVVALVAAPRAEVERPALRLQLPDGVQVGSADEAVGTLEESTGPALRGVIEGLERPAPEAAERLVGRVVRVDAEGRTTELWSSAAEAPFCLARDADDRLLFGTGEPARLYRIEPGGDVVLLSTLREAQLTRLVNTGSRVVLATSNPAASYRVDGTDPSGVFLSRAFDAGGPARWGSIRWREDGPPGRAEFYTRTGNSAAPDSSWSAWSPVLVDPHGSSIVNPDGRFLQWRVRLLGTAGDETRVSDVTVRYRPYNRPPRLVSLHPDPVRPAVTDRATFRWSAADPDGDPLELTLEYRADGEKEIWDLAAETVAEGAPPDGKDVAAPRNGELVWDTSEVPEGGYHVRASASDRAVNAPDEGRRAVSVQVLHVVVDRTPPEIVVHTVDRGGYVVVLEDVLSEVRRLEVLEAGRTRFAPRPVDGVCDSRSESFRLELPRDGADWTVRGVDAAGNVTERSLTGP